MANEEFLEGEIFLVAIFSVNHVVVDRAEVPVVFPPLRHLSSVALFLKNSDYTQPYEGVGNIFVENGPR